MTFITSGPIMDPKSPLYIKRNEDDELLHCVYQSEYVTLLGARQTGKTSLLYMLVTELKDKCTPIYVDLSIAKGASEQEWYRFVSEQISMPLLAEQPREKPVSSKLEFYSFLRKIGERIAQNGKKTVVMFDEVEAIPTEIYDGFFGMIRAIYNRRTDSVFENYVFIFSGATDPREFISEENPSSPFNISKIVYTSDFEREDVGEFLKNLRGINDEAIGCIHGWTNGHPNLTQKVAEILENRQMAPISRQDVDEAVRKILIRGDDNLIHVRKKLEINEQAMELASQIFAGERIRFNRINRVIAALELIGLIREGEEGKCVVRNEIYKRMFEDLAEFNRKLSQNILEAEEDIRKSVFIMLSRRPMSLEELIQKLSKDIDSKRIAGVVEFLKAKKYIEENSDKILIASELGRLRYE